MIRLLLLALLLTSCGPSKSDILKERNKIKRIISDCKGLFDTLGVEFKVIVHLKNEDKYYCRSVSYINMKSESHISYSISEDTINDVKFVIDTLNKHNIKLDVSKRLDLSKWFKLQ